jgi:hypothetical protein
VGGKCYGAGHVGRQPGLCGAEGGWGTGDSWRFVVTAGNTGSGSGVACAGRKGGGDARAAGGGYVGGE